MSGASSAEAGRPAGDDRGAALRDLPRELWADLARVFRRAIEPLDDAELPPAVRPYRGWKPDRLLGERPRRALADALGADARLRERVGELLGDADARARLGSLPLASLVTEAGEQRAAAVLVAAARWDDLAALGALVAERRAARDRAAAERQVRAAPGSGTAGGSGRLEAELASAQRERDEAQRARARADARARELAAQRDDLAATVAGLRREVQRLEGTLRAERAKHRDRLERARRRVGAAEARANIDDTRVRATAEQLEALAATLRDALGEEASTPGAPPLGRADEAGDGSGRPKPAGIPRSAPPAAPGRPCALPPGLTHHDADAVRSLLAAPGILLIVDGYNVTKDPRGVGDAPLPHQRRWLVQLAAGVAARYRVRTIVVFDSAEDLDAPLPRARGVTVDFASDEQTADDRIVRLVEALDRAQPVLLVTSDRELADRCAALGADVVPSDAFLAATT